MLSARQSAIAKWKKSRHTPARLASTSRAVVSGDEVPISYAILSRIHWQIACTRRYPPGSCPNSRQASAKRRSASQYLLAPTYFRISSGSRAKGRPRSALLRDLPREVLEQVRQVVGVFFFLGLNLLDHASRSSIEGRKKSGHFTVAVDRDALCHQVFLDHVDQVLALDVLGVAAAQQSVRRQIGRPAQLHDSLRYKVRVLLFLACMFQKILWHGAGMNTLGHEIVALVSKHTDDLGRERFVEDLDRGLGVAAVTRRYGASLDVLARSLAQCFYVGEKRRVFHGCSLVDVYVRQAKGLRPQLYRA